MGNYYKRDCNNSIDNVMGTLFHGVQKNPQDYINNKLLKIEMWIITVLVCLTINKISIAIVL